MINLMDIREVEKLADRYRDIAALGYHADSENWQYLAKWDPPIDTTSWLPMMYPDADVRGASMFLSELRTLANRGRFVAEIRSPKEKALDEMGDGDALDDAHYFVCSKLNSYGELAFDLSNPARTTYRDGFYDSPEWIALRYRALELHGGKCHACGRTARQGIIIHVDHIKPRSRYPYLELEIKNLQVLCSECNLGKSNVYTTDWRYA